MISYKFRWAVHAVSLKKWLIRGDSQCVRSTVNALPPTNRLHKHPPTCMEEHRRLVMNLENNHVEFCRQHVPGAIHFLFRILYREVGPGGGIIRHRESGTPVTGCAGSPSCILLHFLFVCGFSTCDSTDGPIDRLRSVRREDWHMV